MTPADMPASTHSEHGRRSAGRMDRRRFLAAAGVTAGAMWVAPTVLRSESAWAAGSLCPCQGGTPEALQFLTAKGDTTPNPLPTTCIEMSFFAVTSGFCRVDPSVPIYLWGTGAGSTNSGPMFDDIGVVEVVETSSGTTRWGNIYRFQNYCRHGMNVPTNLVSGYDSTRQRVYTGQDENTWDYLPPAVSGHSDGATQTATPTSWWTNSQPSSPGSTTSVGNPGYTATAPSWNNSIDISALFGNVCGNFTITVTDYNRYQQYKWSNIFIGTTPPDL